MPYQKNKEFHALLDKVDSCLDNELPFVIYRKPRERQVTAIFQSNDFLNRSYDFTERGFVFAPFIFSDNAVLIKADEVITSIFEIDKQKPPGTSRVSDFGKEPHLNLVARGIDEINKGKLKKIVLSRKIEVTLQQPPTEIFQRLLDRYDNAFCYLWFHPAVGMWCGATPETLVYIRDRETHTMSLAATLPVEDGRLPQWGNKEIEEQEMVSTYIGEKLDGLMDELEVGKAESVRAGNLWHLKSEIRGNLSPRTTIKEVVRALHPTPAVCGIPTADAQAFIESNEGYQRTFYTGFLGELNLYAAKEISLFVNLRCMEIEKEKASIFVGGGITKASVPEKEWTETQNKSKTLLNVLQ